MSNKQKHEVVVTSASAVLERTSACVFAKRGANVGLGLAGWAAIGGGK